LHSTHKVRDIREKGLLAKLGINSDPVPLRKLVTLVAAVVTLPTGVYYAVSYNDLIKSISQANGPLRVVLAILAIITTLTALISFSVSYSRKITAEEIYTEEKHLKSLIDSIKHISSPNYLVISQYLYSTSLIDFSLLHSMT
jgi:hypothetical protein